MVTCDDCDRPIQADTVVDAKTVMSRCKSCRSLAHHHRSLRITPLTRTDLELVLAWRSNPKIYRHFRHQMEPLDWDEHVEWFESRSQRRHDFIVRFDERRVGVVSLSADEEVSVYLGDFSAHGYGVATATLEWLCDRFVKRTPFIAEIHEENNPSIRLFERCGFERTHRNGDWLYYEYRSA
ncbi:GNAT family N-acetyltransferase [Natrarchaeobius sp. A-rgal3]|uniref:GNAT family N-acetyltransferase n=1 Tax=Natrarchaeobius versutus TaxID=1679078 RepID=UPI00350F8F0E